MDVTSNHAFVVKKFNLQRKCFDGAFDQITQLLSGMAFVKAYLVTMALLFFIIMNIF